MQELKLYIFISSLLIFGTNLFAQNKGSEPFMKITVKDGRIVKAESYDTTAVFKSVVWEFPTEAMY